MRYRNCISLRNRNHLAISMVLRMLYCCRRSSAKDVANSIRFLGLSLWTKTVGDFSWNFCEEYRVTGCIISIRPTYSLVRLLTYLLKAYTIGSRRIKPAISPKRLKIKQKLLLTGTASYIKSYTGFRLPPKCITSNDLWARFKVTDSSNAAKKWRNTA